MIEVWNWLWKSDFLTPPHHTNSWNSMISFDYSWSLAKNLSNFISLLWKLHNRYCRTFNITLEINCELYVGSLVNVLCIVENIRGKRQVISPKLFGNLSKPMVFGHKLVTYQDPYTNVLLHWKQRNIMSKEHGKAMLVEDMDNVPMWTGK